MSDSGRCQCGSILYFDERDRCSACILATRLKMADVRELGMIACRGQRYEKELQQNIMKALNERGWKCPPRL
jgi:hypothetical protein